MVGPNYHSPEITISDEWVEITPQEAAVVEWWNLFNDPLLSAYIEKAATHNRDILAAEATVLQAIALRQVAAASLFPQISSDINAMKTYFSKNGPVFAIAPSVGNLPGTVANTTGLPFAIQIPQIQNLYNFLFDASWEIDLFGKTRRGIQAAAAQIESAIEQKNGTLLFVTAEIARNYMELRKNQRMATLVEESISLLEKKQAILRVSLEKGYINRLDLDTLEVDLSSAKAQLPPYVAESYKNIYAISVLTGEPPETLLSDLLPIQSLPKFPQDIAVGLRSDILRKRPDVRYAERQLAVATANIGVAVASFFPTFTLFGDAGLQSLSLGKLFNMQSKTFDYGGDLNTPIFQGGQLFGNLRASQAAQTYAAQYYEKTVLTALQEAEQYLTTFHQDIIVTQNLNEALEKTQVLVQITHEQNKRGLIGLTRYIDIQRQLITVEQNLLNSEATALIHLVSLYKALGGGWEKWQGCPQ
jgi:NodT family efflux transporter outer membrane factor (OMF) lipoprotein